MNDLFQTVMIYAGEYQRKLVLNNNGDHKTQSDDETQTKTSRGYLGSRGNEKLTCDIGLVLPGKGKNTLQEHVQKRPHLEQTRVSST
jgi:hypothetical protein